MNDKQRSSTASTKAPIGNWQTQVSQTQLRKICEGFVSGISKPGKAHLATGTGRKAFFDFFFSA